MSRLIELVLTPDNLGMSQDEFDAAFDVVLSKEEYILRFLEETLSESITIGNGNGIRVSISKKDWLRT